MIKANVNYNLRAHATYIRNTLRYRATRFLVIFSALMYAGFATLSLMSALTNNKTYVEYIMFIVLFFVIFLVSVGRLLALNPNKQYKKYSERYPNANYEIKISDKDISIKIDSDYFKKNAVYDFSKISEAREFMGYFILSIANDEQILFCGNDLTEGTAEEVKKLLISKLGKNYKTRERWI